MSKAISSLGLAAGLAVILAMGAVESALARNRTEMESDTITITLRAYDYVHMNRPRLLAAESEATAILAQAGLEARWVDCPTSQAELANYPDCQSAWQATDFVLKVLPKTIVDSMMKGQDALGWSFQCDTLATRSTSVFYDRVSSVFEVGGRAPIPVLLGRAMAHEVGHLLLGTHSHCNRGIMRPFWSGRELSLDGRLYLLFTPEKSRQMKTRLAARAQAWQAEEKLAALRQR